MSKYMSPQKLCYKLGTKVNTTLFEKFLTFSRMVGVYNPNTKEWCLSDVKLRYANPTILSKAFNDLMEFESIIKIEPNDTWEQVKKIVTEVINKPRVISSEVIIDGLNAVVPYDENIENEIRGVLCKKIKRFNFKIGRFEDRELCFYHNYGDSIVFLRGLLPLLKSVHLINYYNKEISEIKDIMAIPDVSLRDYQIEAIKRSLSMISMVGGALVQLPTGGGKTVVALSLLKTLMEYGFVKTAFVVVNSRTLAVQWERVAKQWGIDTGLWTGEEKAISTLTITTFQSINSEYNKISGMSTDLIGSGLVAKYTNADFIIFDEVHHVPAITFKTVASLNTKIHLGLSATPYREDFMDEIIYGLTSVPAYRMRFSDLIEYLVPPTIVNVTIPINLDEAKILENDEESIDEDEDEEDMRGGAKYIRYMKKVLWNERVWQYALWLAGRLPKPLIIHSPLERPASYFANKYKVPFLSGVSSDIERKNILEGLNSGKIPIAIATTVIDEGIDIPALKSLIMLFPGGSRVKLVQRIGRLVRRTSGKDSAYAILLNYHTNDKWFDGVLYRQKAKRDDAIKMENNWKLIDTTYKLENLDFLH